jgi:pimeloyl-ACP methyl ester carboxylesterase
MSTTTSGYSQDTVAPDRVRPASEFSALVRSPVFWGAGVPRGDGHSVLVLPGLGGGDGYLVTIRAWLARIGYRPVRSGLRVNPGWSEELVGTLSDLVQEEASRSGRPVSIVGHSMGGLLGRSVAKARPGAVRRVVALASPLGLGTGEMPRSVGFAAIYSPADRVVRHPSGMSRDAGAANIEVRGSHVGVVFNREAYAAIAEHLARPSPVAFL